MSGTGTSPEQGPAWLRWVLNQAAQTAGRSPEFAAAYQTIAQRRGKKIATIAISRKLPTRQHRRGRDDGRVTKPRACSLIRHEQAPAPRPVI